MFSCQSTNLIKATSPISILDIRQYITDVRSGDFTPFERLQMLLMSLNYKVQAILGGEKHSTVRGNCRRTPTATLDLQPGDLVEVKSKAEILQTLDSIGRNRGLGFTPDMFIYCRSKYRVQDRVDKMINEKTGKVRKIANTVILEGVTCEGKASGGCQRTCYCLWREIWLRKVKE